MVFRNQSSGLLPLVPRGGWVNQATSRILPPDSNLVGVRYFPATVDHPPLRIFYPITRPTSVKAATAAKVGWFDDTGVFPYLSGYAHLGLAKQDTWTFQWVVQPLLFLFSWVVPLQWLRLPQVIQETVPNQSSIVSSRADNNKEEKNEGLDSKTNQPRPKEQEEMSGRLPLIVFSHGLTGTGQENSALAIRWAQEGFVVISVHHTEGSSCRVELADGSTKYYETPSYTNYDPDYRPKQVTVRAHQVLQAYNFLSQPQLLTQPADCPWDLVHLVDPSNAVVAGFSYGASTAARVAVMDQSPFSAALFLDGWFYINVANVEYNFPSQAFEEQVPGMPTLFLMSQQFQEYPKLWAATLQLARLFSTCATQSRGDNDRSDPPNHPEEDEMHNVVVLPNTGHQNFCDVVLWLPQWVLQRIMKGFIGNADPIHVYEEIAQRSIVFLKRVTGKDKK